MAHMWFGDLVTMRWWDDLWLKESFADYMGSHASAAATRYTDAWERFAANRKAWAYQQDQLPSTHPIVADITDLEAAKLNFDGITYAKGAAVLKQLVAFVGEEHFFEGARRYFVAHAYGNTTLEDLLVQLEAASGRDVRAWSRAWLETSGMSTIRLEDAGNEHVLVQTDARPHRLRVGLYVLTGGALSRRDSIDVDIVDERTPIALGDADLVLINDDDLTYAKVRLDGRSLDAVEHALSTLPPLPRALTWSALWNAARDGELPVARYLAVVAAHAPLEENMGLLGGVLANAAYAIGHYLPESERPSMRTAWLETTWKALSAAEPAGDPQLSWARAFAAASAYDSSRAAEVRAILAGDAPEGLRIDPDLRWALLTALATTAHATSDDIDAELERDGTSSGRTAAVRARASEPEQETRIAAWHTAWEDESLSNDHLSATIDGVRAGGRRDLIASLDAGYFERIADAWQNRSIELARRLVIGLFPASDSLDDVDAWLAAHEEAPAALRRLIVEQRDHLARDLRVRASQAQLGG
jgi:aminopeptidase N